MADEQSIFRDRTQVRAGEFPSAYGRTYLPTPPIDDLRARLSPPNGADTQRMNGYRLPQPLPHLGQERRMSSGFAQDPYAQLPNPMNPMDNYADPRRGSLGQHQQVYMVPHYLPIYGSPEHQWPTSSLPQHAQPSPHQQWPPHPNAMPMPLPGYPGLVQRPLPPAPLGPVEKPKKRRSPPSPQYLHMTVQEMIEELAYRKVDTTALQGRKAKKAEYIDQLQRADRNGNRGRGAWKSCHGDVPPLSETEGQR